MAANYMQYTPPTEYGIDVIAVDTVEEIDKLPNTERGGIAEFSKMLKPSKIGSICLVGNGNKYQLWSDGWKEI